MALFQGGFTFTNFLAEAPVMVAKGVNSGKKALISAGLSATDIVQRDPSWSLIPRRCRGRLILDVDATNGGRTEIFIAALAGRAAGAMSMAAGEYVCVSSQADSEDSASVRDRPLCS